MAHRAAGALAVQRTCSRPGLARGRRGLPVRSPGPLVDAMPGRGHEPVGRAVLRVDRRVPRLPVRTACRGGRRRGRAASVPEAARGSVRPSVAIRFGPDGGSPQHSTRHAPTATFKPANGVARRRDGEVGCFRPRQSIRPAASRARPSTAASASGSVVGTFRQATASRATARARSTAPSTRLRGRHARQARLASPARGHRGRGPSGGRGG